MRIKVLAKGAKAGSPSFEYEPGYEFVRDPACSEYDWLVVYDELPGRDVGTFHDGYEPLRCPRACTILATSEPTSIKHYSRAYTGQFGHLLTNRPFEAERHPHYHLGRGYYRWFIGRSHAEAVRTLLPPKARLVSTVCSSKQMRGTRHLDRFNFITALAAAIPEMDWFGHGVRPFGRKYEVTDSYRYQVVVENHIAPHHWSEKIADAFLSECLPFYAGAPDLADDFPPASFIPIPIDDPAKAVETIKAAIQAGEYDKRLPAIREAKRLVLTKYNFWAQVIDVIKSAEQAGPPEGRPPAPCPRLYARKALRAHSLRAALEDGIHHVKQWLSPLAP